MAQYYDSKPCDRPLANTTCWDFNQKPSQTRTSVLFCSSGPRAYTPDAPQPVDLLCNPIIVQTVPTFAASPPSRPCYPRDPWQWRAELLRGRETWPTIWPKCTTSTEHLGIFYMPQIYDMGPTALLPLRRKARWGFFSPWKIRRLRPGLNLRTWVPKASTLPLDHRSRLFNFYSNTKLQKGKVHFERQLIGSNFAKGSYLGSSRGSL